MSSWFIHKDSPVNGQDVRSRMGAKLDCGISLSFLQHCAWTQSGQTTVFCGSCAVSEIFKKVSCFGIQVAAPHSMSQGMPQRSRDRFCTQDGLPLRHLLAQ